MDERVTRAASRPAVDAGAEGGVVQSAGGTKARAPMRIGKVFGLGGIQSAVLLALSFLSIKLTAVFVGPEGVALVAQVQSLLAVCSGPVTNTLATAVTRLGAEYGSRSDRTRVLVAAADRVAWVTGLTTLVVLAVASRPLTDWLLGSNIGVWPIILAGAGMLMLSLAAVVRGALGSNQEVAAIASSNIAGGVLGFLALAGGTLAYGLSGALVATALGGAFQLLGLLLVARQMSSTPSRMGWGSWNGPEGRRIGAFFPMLLVHMASLPLGLIVLRQFVTSHLSLADAGFFQASYRLAEAAMTVITSTMSLYFMPRLGALVNKPVEFRQEILSVVWRVAALSAALSVVIVLARHLVVRLIFSHDFAPVEDLLPLQMLASVVKTVAWTLQFALVALVRQKWYIGIELAVPLSLVLLGALFVAPWGVVGASAAFVPAALLHLVLVVTALRDVLWLDRRGDAK